MTHISILGPSILLAAVSGCQEPTLAFLGPQVLGGQEISAEILNRGRIVFGNFCASCHAGDGSGTGPSARSLKTQPRDFRQADFRHKSTDGDRLPTDDDLLRTVGGGRADTGMPAFPHLTPEDRLAVVHYLKTFSPRWSEAGVSG